MGVAEAAFDWGLHLAASPGRQAALALSALSKQADLAQASALLPSEDSGGSAPKPAAADDRRFAAVEWRYWPFSFYAEGFLATQRWWDEATSQINGATRHHLALLNFIARQALDMVAPSNFVLTNPVALKQTLSEGGTNLIKGSIAFFGRSWARHSAGGSRPVAAWQPTSACGAPLWMKMRSARVSAVCAGCIRQQPAMPFS
jgi:polyhydroxyalkanoate synthase subunit PhaC